MRIHNTETGRKEQFEPAALPVKMYVCGLTPKNDPHLGHARLFVVNDTIRRYLEFRGYPVHFVQNFTDIDDKIIAAGQRDGIAASDAARRYTEAYFRDMDLLGIRRADDFTYVTEFIPRIIAVVGKLVEQGHAYVVDGDVFFSVPSFPAYGRLSGRDEEAMRAGARIEPDERKRDPRDFALWKSAKPGEPWWESPWGRGRPGWHIECSTMALDTLGSQIDIHGGGADLIFPHHENEIAQSESLTGLSPFVRYWVHTGMLSLPGDQGDQEKMAHSGTFVTTRSILARRDVPPAGLRTYLLGQHYRANLVFSEEQLRGSVTRWQRWVTARESLLRLIGWAEGHAASAALNPDADTATLEGELDGIRGDFIAAMDDDFNTSLALSYIDLLAKRSNEFTASIQTESAAPELVAALKKALATLTELTGVLGISLEVADTAPSMDVLTRAQIEALIALRTAARQTRNWAESDRIRIELETRFGVTVQDTAQGTTWTVR